MPNTEAKQCISDDNVAKGHVKVSSCQNITNPQISGGAFAFRAFSFSSDGEDLSDGGGQVVGGVLGAVAEAAAVLAAGF